MMTEQPPTTTAARFRAELLIASVEDALGNGVRHFDETGKPLLTLAAIIEELSLNRGVTIEEPTPETLSRCTSKI